MVTNLVGKDLPCILLKLQIPHLADAYNHGMVIEPYHGK